ncbi:hypothetical protein GDO86_013925 [Hymenochirus boettgeri]|uniref:Uncharacterized protein n=1 Tax=Hymenochirus boettgeri TaxID=247094 RepID=A0A8T2JLX6_9PIPI|nr:hypothetical protein GDO86_013925 [Hymenochirus boettgeri]
MDYCRNESITHCTVGVNGRENINLYLSCSSLSNFLTSCKKANYWKDSILSRIWLLNYCGFEKEYLASLRFPPGFIIWSTLPMM